MDEQREILLEADSDSYAAHVVEARVEAIEQLLVRAEVGRAEVLPACGDGFGELIERAVVGVELREGAGGEEEAKRNGDGFRAQVLLVTIA